MKGATSICLASVAFRKFRAVLKRTRKIWHHGLSVFVRGSRLHAIALCRCKSQQKLERCPNTSAMDRAEYLL